MVKKSNRTQNHFEHFDSHANPVIWSCIIQDQEVKELKLKPCPTGILKMMHHCSCLKQENFMNNSSDPQQKQQNVFTLSNRC